MPSPSLRLPLALAGLLLSCSSPPEATVVPDAGPPAATCAEGFGLVGDQCERLLPAKPCPPGTMATLGQKDCQPTGWSECPGGFEPDPSGWGCREILPAAACGPGTMAVLGKQDCQPVGWLGCPAGFEADPSGWGCRELLPSTPCIGATRAVLGQRLCQPVGSCSAAFPPASATLFVDPTTPASQLDGKHFTTLVDALSVAPPGAVVSVAPGTYAEPLDLHKPVTLVGRCAEKVILDAGLLVGLAARGTTVELRGFTVRGGLPAVYASGGGKLRLIDCVVEGSHEIGGFVGGLGSELTLTGSVVRDTLVSASGQYGHGLHAESAGKVTLLDSEIAASGGIGVAGLGRAKVLLTSTVVRDTTGSGAGDSGQGVVMTGGAEATLDRCAVVGNVGLGVFGSGAGSQVVLSESVVRDTATGRSVHSAGASVEDSAHLTATRCAFVGNHDFGVLALGSGAIGELHDSVVRSGQPSDATDSGVGMAVLEHAQGTITGSAFVGNRDSGVVVAHPGSSLRITSSLVRDTVMTTGGARGWGVAAQDGASLAISGSDVESNTAYGIALGLAGTRASVRSCVVRGTLRAQNLGPTDPVRVQGVGVLDGAQLTLADSALIENRHLGLFVSGADAAKIAARADVSNLVVRRTLPEEDLNAGNASAIYAGPAARLTVKNAALVESSTEGLTLSGAGTVVTASGLVVRDTLANNKGDYGRAIGLELGAQLTLDHAAIVRNRDISVILDGAGTRVTAADLLVEGTQSGRGGSTGRGIGVQNGALLELSASAVHGSRELGVHVYKATARLTDTLLSATTGRPDGETGDGVLIQGRGTLVFERGQIEGSSGVGLVASDSSAELSSSTLKGNSVGVHVQDGSTLGEVEELPAQAGPAQVLVTTDTRFVDNGTRVGTGTLPLPAPARPVK